MALRAPTPCLKSFAGSWGAAGWPCVQGTAPRWPPSCLLSPPSSGQVKAAALWCKAAGARPAHAWAASQALDQDPSADTPGDAHLRVGPLSVPGLLLSLIHI